MNEMTAPFSSVGPELYKISAVMRRAFDKKARHLGFTQNQWRALLTLGKNEGISQTGLAEHLDMQPISLARMLERMDKLVERRRDPNDRRAIKLYLTPAAAPVVASLHNIANELFGMATQGMTPVQLFQLAQILQLMRTNLESSLTSSVDGPLK